MVYLLNSVQDTQMLWLRKRKLRNLEKNWNNLAIYKNYLQIYMSIITSKRLFYCDSHNRVAGSHSNFSLQLEYKNENYDHCVILQATIPKSYYLIQSGKNYFTL